MQEGLETDIGYPCEKPIEPQAPSSPTQQHDSHSPPQFVLYSVEREVQRTILKLGELTKRLHTKWQDFQVFFPIRSENLAARTCPQKNNGEITSRETDQTKKNPANVSSERGWRAVLVQSHSLVSLLPAAPS